MTPKLVRGAKYLARLSGVAALALGAAYWSGVAIPLHLHMLFGGLLVAALWMLAIAARSRAPAIAVLTALWGLLIPVLGMMQLHLSWGEHHWAAQLLHVTVGILGMGQAEHLAKRLNSR